MLLFLSFLLLIACVFGFKQSLELKRSKDLLNKQGLELSLLRSQYQHNLSLLSQALKDKDDLTSDISSLLKEIQGLNAEVKDLKLDLELSEELQINEDRFQDVIESHVLNVLSHINLEQAYENACEYDDLEINIEDLIK